MEISVKVQNSNLGAITSEFKIETSSTTITVKELIIEKVKQEVTIHNQKVEESLQAIGESTNYEQVINQKSNRYKLVPADIERECYIAFDAFAQNRFFLFINDKQYLNLEEPLPVASIIEVLFLKLTPLTGG